MRTLRMIGAAVVAVVLGAGVCACSDDDDDSGSSSPKVGVSIITTNDGEELVLTDYGNYMHFSYDSQGRCTSATGGEADYKMSYDPYKVTVDFDDELISLSFSFNGSGYVSKISYSYEEEDYIGTVNLSYDSDGHLTKAAESYKGSDKWSSWSGTATATYTWKSGDMTKVVVDWKDVDTEDGTYTEHNEWTYEYSSTVNDYKQITRLINDGFEGTEISFLWDLGFIGYFGKGTTHLPVSYNVTYEEDDDGEKWSGSSSSCTWTYTKNSNGTLKEGIETYGNSSYTRPFTYATVGSSTRSATTDPFSFSDKSSVVKRLMDRRCKHSHEEAERM